MVSQKLVIGSSGSRVVAPQQVPSPLDVADKFKRFHGLVGKVREVVRSFMREDDGAES